MSIAKLSTTIYLASVFLVLVSAEHIEKWGNPNAGDTVVFNLPVKTQEAHIGKVYRAIDYPPEEAYGYFKISAAHVHDLNEDKGSYKLVEGGVGGFIARLELRSAFMSDINMVVKIYGQYIGRCNPLLE